MIDPLKFLELFGRVDKLLSLARSRVRTPMLFWSSLRAFIGIVSVIICFTLRGNTAFASSKKVVRRPATQTATSAPIEIRSLFGEKAMTFTISTVSNGGEIKLESRAQAPMIRTISQKDLEFFKKKVAELPSPNNELRLCPRSYISIKMNEQKTLACIGSKTPIGKASTDLINLLSLQF